MGEVVQAKQDDGAVHTSVLVEECLLWLAPTETSPLLIDGTLGEGGHTKAFLERYPQLSVVGIDADPHIQERAKRRLASFGSRVSFFCGWSDVFFMHHADAYKRPNLILFDLGISLFHYTHSKRGFSFAHTEALDMRLDCTTASTAADIVNTWSEKDLADVLYRYGEERYSRRIARAIVQRREEAVFTYADDLAEVVAQAVPKEYRHARLHPATKSFQALRIAVNDELARLDRLLTLSFDRLAIGGSLGVITFHSLEDRLVKHFFQYVSKRCHCPPQQARCTCGNEPFAMRPYKKPLGPTGQERHANPPSRSAKLRVIHKLREREGHR